MSRPIDEKIVAMKMDNSDFVRKVKDTLKSFATINKGMSDAGNVDLSAMSKSISDIENKFSATGVVIATIISRLTTKAMDMGQELLANITDPLVEGGKKRALNIEQATFQFQGLGMDVEASMNSALEAVKGTAFGLDEAAVVAAQFGATGMRAGDEMTKSLRGISGVAAMTGSSYSDIGSIFTKVAGNGRLMGDDLLRLSSRGINAAATLAKSMGKSEAAVRTMVTNGAISFDMFSGAMADAFGEHATRANETYTGSLSNMNAALARIGASFAAPEFENKRDIFNALTPKIDELAAAIGPLIEAWNKFRRMKAENLISFINKISFDKFVELGGITNLVDAFWNVMNAGKSIMNAFTGAFKGLGPSTGMFSKILVLLTSGLKHVTAMFTLTAAGVEKLSIIFRGIFSVFSSVWEIAKRLGTALANLIPKPSGGGDILGYIADIAKMAIAFNESLKMGNLLTDMLDGLAVVTSFIAREFRTLGKVVAEVWSILIRGDFTGQGPWEEDSGFVKWLFNVRDAAQSAIKFLGSISLKEIGKGFMDFFVFMRDGFKWIVDGLVTMGTAIKNALPEGSTIFAGGFIAGLVTLLGFVIKMGMDLVKAFKDWGTLGTSLKDIGSGVSGVLDDVSGALSSFSMSVKANALLTIAIALGILAASFWVLSGLNGAQIAKGLYMIIGSLTALVGSLAIMSKFDITGTGAKASLQIVALAIAFAILSVALKSISGMGWMEITKGLIGLGGVMLIFAGTMALMTKFGGNLNASALQLVAIAGTVLLLVIALKQIADMDPKSLVQGMVGLAVLLGVFAGALILISKFGGGKIAASSLQFVAIAGSILIMVSAIKKIAEIDTGDLTKGLVTITVILGAVAGFTALTSGKGLLATGVGLTMLAGALVLLLVPITVFGKMELGTLVQGLAGMAVALVAIGAASMMMTGMIAAGAGLILVATGLNLLLVPIMALSVVPFMALVAGIGGLALAILLIGGAAAVLGLAGPALLLGAAGIAALGIAMLAAGLGMSLFSAGLVTLAAMTATAITTIVATLGTLILGLASLIPMAVEFVTEVIMQIAEAIAINAPVLAEKVFETLLAIMTTIAENAPLIYEQFLLMVLGLIEMWGEWTPVIVEAVADGILAMLAAIAGKVGDFVIAGADIIIAFIRGVGESHAKIANAAMETVVNFIDSMTEAVRTNGPQMTDAVLRLMGSVLLVVVDAGIQMVNALFGWIPGVKSATADIGKTAEKYIEDNFGAEELGRNKGKDFSGSLKGTSKQAGDAASSLSSIAMKGLDVDMSSVGSDFGGGFAAGIGNQSTLGKVTRAAKSLASKAASTVKGWLGIASPSRVARKDGGWFGIGLAQGIGDKTKEVADKAKLLALTAKDSLHEFIDGFELPEEDNELHFKAVIDYDTFNTDGFGRVASLAVTPDTSVTRGLVSETSATLRQNGNISPGSGDDNSKQETTNLYEINVTAGGSMSRAEVKKLAGQIQTEIKNENDKHRLGRGEQVAF